MVGSILFLESILKKNMLFALITYSWISFTLIVSECMLKIKTKNALCTSNNLGKYLYLFLPPIIDLPISSKISSIC